MNRAAASTLAIFECLVRHKEGLTLTELARTLDLPTSTTHELIRTLVDLGYVERNIKTRRFRPSLKLLDLGQTYLHDMDLYVASVPLLGPLSLALDGVATVAVFHRAQGMVVAIAEEGGVSNSRMIRQNATWWHSVLHCGSTGKVFLANLTHEEVERILDRVGTPQFTPYTITDRSKLRKELQQIRECGYALDRQEVALGRACIAVPVEVRQVQLGALSLRITPPERLQDDFIHHAVEVMRKTAASIANGIAQSSDLAPEDDDRGYNAVRENAPATPVLSRNNK